jgi:protein-disulfide isomerase
MRQSGAAKLGVFLAAILALSGLVISGILLQHHLVMSIGGDPLLGGVCKDVSGKSTCDEALASWWGSIALGKGDSRTVIPTAMLGFVFFAFMSAWYVTVGRPSASRRGLHLLPVLGAVIGAVVCVVLDIIMWTKLAEPCWFCLATHVISWALLLLTLLLIPRSGAIAAGPVVAQPAGGRLETSYGKRAEEAYPPMHLVLAALLLAVAVSLAGWSGYRSRLFYARWKDYDKDYAAEYMKFMIQPKLDIPIMPDDPIRGPVDAPHTVVVFSDFQCPFCRVIASMLQERSTEFPNKFRVVFKHFPMNTKCNDYVKNTLHSASCAAAVTAEAARILGGPDMFWKMHDELFRDQAAFARNPEEYVKQACQKLGLSNEEVWKKIKTYAIWEPIRVDEGQGNAVGVNSTPTLFFDGRRMSGWGNRHTWRFLIEGGPVPTTQPAVQITTSGPTTGPAAPFAAPELTTRPAAAAPTQTRSSVPPPFQPADVLETAPAATQPQQ